MWGIIIQAAILAGIYVFHKIQDWQNGPLQTPLPEYPELPRIAEGTPYPLLYGQGRVSPILAWSGNHKILPGGTFTLDMLFILGIPYKNGNTRITGMFAGDTRLDFQTVGPPMTGDGNQMSSSIIVSASIPGSPFKAFGGRLEFLNGKTTQQLVDPSTGVPTTWAGKRMIKAGIPWQRIPGYRGYALVYCFGANQQQPPDPSFFEAFAIGTSPQPPAISFEYKTFPASMLNSQTGTDNNPADVVNDIITGPFGRLGISSTYVDNPSFVAAATTLDAEAHGYTRAITTADDATTVIGDILKQIDGVLYEDPTTKTLKLKLIRADYSIGSIPNINPSNGRLTGYSNGGWRDTPNKVRVTYQDRSRNYQNESASSSNLANAVGQDNRPIEAIIQMSGVATAALAKSIVARELNLLSRPIAKCRAIVDRTFWATNVGDPVSVTWPEYNLTQVAFRVASVDRGQPNDGKISLDLIQDVFTTTATGFPGAIAIPFQKLPTPITTRVVTEAPYWMMLQLYNNGTINTPEVQRLLACVRPDDGSAVFAEVSSSDAGVTYLDDVPLNGVPVSAKVNTAYAREIGPYDTTTGLVIDTLLPGTSVTNISFTANQNRIFGGSLILVGTEIMQYESVTDLGGGLLRLNNVWREQLDTASHDHPVGELVYWIGTSWGATTRVGLRGWYAISALAQAKPQRGVKLGSGEEATDTVAISGRGYLPSRGANFSIAGEVMAGTQGLPASSAPAGQLGYFRKVSNLEEGFAYAWNNRDRLFTNVSRGDDAAETPSDVDPTTWDVYVQKLRSGFTPNIAANDAEVAIKSGLAGSDSLAAALVGGAGYGDLDIILHTRRIKPAGAHGISPPITYSEWDAPRIRARAERWRNLVGNARFDFHGAGTNITPAWTVASGTPTIAAGVKSITLNVNDCYIGGSGASSAGATQTFDVTGYKARGMTMLLFFYARQLVSGAGGDTVTAVIAALDATNTLLGSTTVNGGAITPPFGNWQRYAGSLVAPAGTTQVRVTFTCGNSNAVVTEVEVRIGHAPVNNVLANSSLDTVLTSWTTDAGGWINANAIASASTGYAQGGAFAASTLHQDYTLTTGYDTGGGTAIINMWRAQTLANDTGKVTLQCLDVSNVVLASSTTGFENLAVLNQWYRRRLAVDIPVGTTKIRLILDATRTLGAGNSGACFDECILDVHKDLSDARYYRALDFSQPTVQQLPLSWQEWHLSYPALTAAGIPDPAVLNVTNNSVDGGNVAIATGIAWSDGAAHTSQQQVKVFGLFGAGSWVKDGGASTIGYRFDRQSGAGALDLQSQDGATKIANWDAATPFTVIAYLRIDEDAFATACGVTGRTGASAGSPGWGMEVNASGEAVATLWGASGTKTVASTGTKVSDGAIHQIGMSHDPVGHVLTLTVDNGYSTTVSTASGLGEIQNTLAAIVLRIGRSRDSIDTIPGVILRTFYFPAALSAAQMQSMFTYGKDPTAALTTYTRSKEAWTPGLFEATLDGTLVKMAANQVALGFRVDLAADGGSGWGFALCKGNTNLVPSFNFAGASWVADGSTTLTQSVIDATAKPRGVTVVSPNTSNGFKLIGVTLGAGATAQLAFYARAASGTPTLNIELQNASNVVKQTIGVSLSGGTKWKLYFASFTLWDNSSPTARFRFVSASGSTTFDLTHVMWIGPGTEVASLWPDAGQTLADVTATLTENQPKQFNAEGEIIVTGVGTVVSPGQSTIVAIDNAVNSKNWRELLSGASQQPRMDHYDATPANVSSQGTAINWRDTMWTIRGRWCSIGTLDNATTPFGGVVTVANVNSAVYGRTAVFTFDGTVNTRIRLGIGASSALNGYLRSVVVRAREEKLI